MTARSHSSPCQKARLAPSPVVKGRVIVAGLLARRQEPGRRRHGQTGHRRRVPLPRSCSNVATGKSRDLRGARRPTCGSRRAAWRWRPASSSMTRATVFDLVCLCRPESGRVALRIPGAAMRWRRRTAAGCSPRGRAPSGTCSLFGGGESDRLPINVNSQNTDHSLRVWEVGNGEGAWVKFDDEASDRVGLLAGRPHACRPATTRASFRCWISPNGRRRLRGRERPGQTRQRPRRRAGDRLPRPGRRSSWPATRPCVSSRRK